MIAQTLPPNPASVRRIEVTVTDAVAAVQPSMAVGEVVRFHVRTNEAGQGQLFFRGLLIPATLPEGLQPGDRVIAKVMEAADQVILRILDLEKHVDLGATAAGTDPAAVANLADQIEELLQPAHNLPVRDVAPAALPAETAAAAIAAETLPEAVVANEAQTTGEGGVTPPQIPGAPASPGVASAAAAPAAVAGTAAAAAASAALTTAEASAAAPAAASALPPAVRAVIDSLGILDQGGDADKIFAQLMATTDGSLPELVRSQAEALKTLLSGEPRTREERFLAALRATLGSLLGRGGEEAGAGFDLERALLEGGEERSLRRAAELLASAVSDELKSPSVRRSGAEHVHDMLASVRTELLRARDNPESAEAHLTDAYEQLKRDPAAARTSQLGVRTAHQLDDLAQRLEQLGTAQERLNQLNPVLHALGEPAVILIPFIAQGLLSHSELNIDPDERQRGGKRESGEEGGADTTPYQRVQVSVPLPDLGLVHVDVAHRGEEILARFTFDDPEAARFVEERLEALAAILREQQFTKTDLGTHVGSPPQETTPAWVDALHLSGTSIRA